MEIFVGTPQEISQKLLEDFDEDVQFSFDVLNLDEEMIYIVHVNKDTNDIEIFEKREEGTPIEFQRDSDLPTRALARNSKDLENDDEADEVWDPSSYVLPALYGVDKKGKERIWKIWVVKNTVYKSYGETKGLKTPSSRTFKGLNVGKKNATTANEQAKREAERDWVKQLDKNYHPKTPEGLTLEKKVMAAKKKQGGVNVNIDALLRDRDPKEDIEDVHQEDNEEGPRLGANEEEPLDRDEELEETPDESENDVLPMHCQVWSTEPKCLKYFDFDSGVYIQPKLDGVRCLVKIRNGRVILATRSGKDMVWLNHLRDQVKIFLSGEEDIQLDCEVYAERIVGIATYNEKKKNYSYEDIGQVHEGDDIPELEMEQRFDVISGAARPTRNTPHPLESQLCLYVFDIADPTGELDQDERFEILKRLFSSNAAKSGKTSHIKRVETKVIYYQEDVEDFHDEMSEKDYEGVVLRSRDLYYESHRKSLHMRKHKHFIDEEYPITDAICDEGVGRENFRWICEKIIESPETGENILTTFTVKPMGTREQRWNWYDHSDDFLGKLLNVRYQDLTYEGVPRFPRGTHIRDYDE
jgi:ATP-dependent DNA ligase